MFFFFCSVLFLNSREYVSFFPAENSTGVNGGFEVKVLTLVAQVTLFLASLFGNSIIIHIIRTDNSMRTTTNYLILNQACSDLLISFTELTDAIHISFTGRLWTGGIVGLVSCKILVMTFFSPLSFSVWILTAIAVDRFYAVARPIEVVAYITTFEENNLFSLGVVNRFLHFIPS